MKVLIVTNIAPFVWGGAEELAAHLNKQIILAGHESEILRIPFSWDPPARILSQMLMVKNLELWNVDHVIALKFPAYLIRHPRKTLWLIHQFRQAYDLFDTDMSGLPGMSYGENLSQVIRKADNECLAGLRNIYTISDVTRERLRTFNGIEGRVLLPPVNDPESFVGGASRGYIFAAGRINQMKRQHLLIEALAHTLPEARLVVAGPVEKPEYGARLVDMANSLGVSDRVTFDFRFLPRSVYADYVNHAAAVAYVPYDEDALSYVGIEAATAAKPIITATNSGGLLGLVSNSATGWVANPDPVAIANAMNNAIQNVDEATRYGVNLKDLWSAKGVTWPETIKALLQ